MSNLDAVKINKGRLGANRNQSDRAVSGLIIAGPKPDNLNFKETVTLYSAIDAQEYGIDETFDYVNNVNVYRHISEFFRMANNGTELHFMMVENTNLLEDIAKDTLGDMAKQLLIDANGKIRQLAIAVNPAALETPAVNGLRPDVLNAIAKGQALAIWAYDNFMPCQVFLEGYGLDGNASAAEDLRALDDLDATKVSLVIGQDYAHADTKTGVAQKYADVGTILGVCSSAAINQNIGDNEAFNLTDATKEVWMIPGLSNHKKNTEVYSQLQTFEDKGYIFGLSYPGLAGVRINNDHVCAEIIIDQEGNMNEHTIAYGRVMDDAARQLRSVYLPKIKKTYPVSSDGTLPQGVVTSLEVIGTNVFDDMANAVEISSGIVEIDPKSDLLIAKELKVAFQLQPTGVLGFLNGTLNLKSRQNG